MMFAVSLYPLLLALNGGAGGGDGADTRSSSSSAAAAARVVSLSRFAVKGLGPTPLAYVTVTSPGETFPDDRRFALLKRKNEDKFNGDDPEWLHKEKFLCAFSDPDLMARFDCDYEIVPGRGDVGTDGVEGAQEEIRRMLTVYRRDVRSGERVADSPAALGPVDLSAPPGRTALGEFFSAESGEDVVCVTAAPALSLSGGGTDGGEGAAHTHQFGNTRSGVRERGDTRTVHLVNAATVRELSGRVGVELNPGRFRPNMVVDGLHPWEEFEWVGQTVRCMRRSRQSGDEIEANDSPGGQSDGDGYGIELDVIDRTVRCEGVGIDPNDPAAGKLDMPKLLQEHYPEHGPFFGVYAVISKAGRVEVGDELVVLPAGDGAEG